MCAFAVAGGTEWSDAADVGVVEVYAADDVADVADAAVGGVGVDAVDAVDAVDDADSDAGGAVDAGTGSALRRLATEESSIVQSSPGAWHCRCCCWSPPSCCTGATSWILS